MLATSLGTFDVQFNASSLNAMQRRFVHLYISTFFHFYIMQQCCHAWMWPREYHILTHSRFYMHSCLRFCISRFIRVNVAAFLHFHISTFLHSHSSMPLHFHISTCPPINVAVFLHFYISTFLHFYISTFRRGVTDAGLQTRGYRRGATPIG